ncbi:hypothetical protein HII31_09432, partial [Pseudocercospora fuligena]
MHFSQLITLMMLAAASNAAPDQPEKRAANKCTVGQTYCGKYLKNQGSGSNQNLGWNNNQIIAALDNTPPGSINLRSGGGIVNNSVFLCKSPKKSSGGGGEAGAGSSNNRLDWVAYCTSGCDSYTGNSGNDRCS